MRGPADDTDILPGMLGTLVGYHLRRASNVLSADFALALGGTGVRQTLFAVLSIVHDSPGVSQGSVARQLGIQRANMVALINELLERDFLVRTVSSEDRRAYELSLSEVGQKAYAYCASAIRDHEDALLADLSKAERAVLISLLERIERMECP